MRILCLSVATAAIFTIAACSGQPAALEPIELGRVSTHEFEGRNAFQAARASGDLTVVPNDYRKITLPAPTVRGEPQLAIVPWEVYLDHEKANTLGGLAGANMTDLVALQASYGRTTAEKYAGICAPTSLVVDGASQQAALSRGTRFGLFQRSCKWALVVLPQSSEKVEHVL